MSQDVTTGIEIYRKKQCHKLNETGYHLVNMLIKMTDLQISACLRKNNYDIIKKIFQQCQFCPIYFVYINKGT
jgi:hypothetical protein